MTPDRRTVKLRDVLECVIDHRGRTPKKLGGDFVEQGVRVISAKQIRRGGIDLSLDPRFITEEMYARWMPNPLRPRDVLLTSEAPLGQVARILDGQRLCLGQRLFALRADEQQLDSSFLYYALQSPHQQARLHARASGTTALGIRQSQLVDVDLDLPPLAEQRRIAQILEAIDSKVQHDQSLSRKLEEGARLVVDKAIAGTTEQTAVYDGCEVVYGAAFSSSHFGAEGMPVLRIRDLATHDPGMKTTEQHRKATVVSEGDIVVGMDGEFRAHVWHGPPSLLNQRMCMFVPRSGVSRAFVWRAIQAPLAFIEATESGTTVIHLGKADIDEFRLPLLSPDAMRRLAIEADPLLALSSRLARQAQLLASIREELLPRLISGEVRWREATHASSGAERAA